MNTYELIKPTKENSIARSFLINPDLFKLIKSHCYMHRVSFSEYVRQALMEKYIKETKQPVIQRNLIEL